MTEEIIKEVRELSEFQRKEYEAGRMDKFGCRIEKEEVMTDKLIEEIMKDIINIGYISIVNQSIIKGILDKEWKEIRLDDIVRIENKRYHIKRTGGGFMMEDVNNNCDFGRFEKYDINNAKIVGEILHTKKQEIGQINL